MKAALLIGRKSAMLLQLAKAADSPEGTLSRITQSTNLMDFHTFKSMINLRLLNTICSLWVCTFAAVTIQAARSTPPPPDAATPSIDAIPNQAVLQGGQKVIPVIVGSEPSFSDAWIVSAVSSNPTVLPNESAIFFVNGTGTNRFIHIKAPSGAGGTTTITVRARDSRGADAQTSFLLTIRTVNTPPRIQPINDVEAEAGKPTSIALIIDDDETSLDALKLQTTSDTGSIVAPQDVTFTGTGNGTIAILKPSANSSGVVAVTFTVLDSDGGKASASFNVFVTRLNTAPEISGVGNFMMDANTTSPSITFNVFDAETPLTKLRVTATSAKPSIIPSENIKITGDASERHVQITPLPNRGGVVPITLSVKDGVGAVAETSFLAVVQGPDLQLEASTTQLFLRWANLEEFNLRFLAEGTASAQPPYTWQPLSQTPALKSGVYEISLPVPSGQSMRLFRLRRLF